MQKNGFTLLEVMLVIALVLVVGFLVAAFSTNFIAESAVRQAPEQFRSIFNKAQAYACSGRNHNSWGVHYEGATLTLFEGDSYAGRDRAFDESIPISDYVDVVGFDEVIFRRPDGHPNQVFSDIRFLSGGAQPWAISLNSEGVVQ